MFVPLAVRRSPPLRRPDPGACEERRYSASSGRGGRAMRTRASTITALDVAFDDRSSVGALTDQTTPVQTRPPTPGFTAQPPCATVASVGATRHGRRPVARPARRARGAVATLRSVDCRMDCMWRGVDPECTMPRWTDEPDGSRVRVTKRHWDRGSHQAPCGERRRAPRHLAGGRRPRPRQGLSACHAHDDVLPSLVVCLPVDDRNRAATTKVAAPRTTRTYSVKLSARDGTSGVSRTQFAVQSASPARLCPTRST